MQERFTATSTPAWPRSWSLNDGISAPEKALVRLCLVDDNEEVRTAVAELLDSQPALRAERQFPTAEGALAALERGSAPDVILLDINLGSESGIDAIRPIKALAPSTRVLMLTTFFDTIYESEAREAGASGFLLKSYEVPQLVRLIHAAYDGQDGPGLFSSSTLRRVPVPEPLLVSVAPVSSRSESDERRPGLLRGLLNIFAVCFARSRRHVWRGA